MPAPSDYAPKIDLTKPAAPQHSVAGPYKACKRQYSNTSLLFIQLGLTLLYLYIVQTYISKVL